MSWQFLSRRAVEAMHAEQLRHLLDVMRWPTVSFGVIPRRAPRRGVCPEESFTMTDTELVNVELVSGYLRVTGPEEVQMYVEAWERLFALAVHGQLARTLITAALESLDPGEQRG